MRECRTTPWPLRGAVLAITLVIAACGNSGGSTAPQAGESAHNAAREVPLVYVKRVNTLGMNLSDGAPSAAGGDLMVREQSSPSATEHNLTATFTQGKGDASDPEVSYDGKKIVFAMRCPMSNTSTIDGVPACTGRWNIWEYDMSRGGLAGGSFRRITASTRDDDVDPAYLPAGRGFVFSSNRPARSKMLQAAGTQPDFAPDDHERQRVLNLHTMEPDGDAIEQISFNHSHDRNPVVRPNGDIMFSRGEHDGQRNRFAIFRTQFDGTDTSVLYRAQSPGNSFLHPRDMDPKGKYKGFVSSSLISLSGPQQGGALMFVDTANGSGHHTPANRTVPAQGGRSEITVTTPNMDRGLSRHGRITSPYPLWDGSDRVLLSYRPCEVTHNGVVVSCATLSDEEMARVVAAQPLADRGRRRPAAGQRAAAVRGLPVRSGPADLADRGCAAAGFHVHRCGGHRGAPGAGRHQPDPHRPGAGRPRAGPDRGAQRVRHRQARPPGRRHADGGRPARGLQRRHRDDAPGRHARHPRPSSPTWCA